MTSRISGNSGYSGIYEDASDGGGSDSGSRRSSGSSRASSVAWYADSLPSFQSTREARKADDDLRSFLSYVSNAVSDHPGGIEAPEEDHTEAEPSRHENEDDGSLVSYLFQGQDVPYVPSHASDSGSTVWGVDKGEYERMQREEGMPSLEEESAQSTASILSQDVFYDARSSFTNKSGSSSKAPSSASTSNSRRSQAISRLRAANETGSLISDRSNSSGQSQVRSSQSSQGSQSSNVSRRSKRSSRGPSIASDRMERAHSRSGSTATLLSFAQDHSRWVPPRSRASGLDSVQEFAEGDELSQLNRSLMNVGDVNRRRFTAQANDLASRLNKELSFQDRRTEIRTALAERRNTLPSISSGGFSETDSAVISRLRRETNVQRQGGNDAASSGGAALDRSWAVFDDMNRREP